MGAGDIELRPVEPEHYDQFEEYVQYAFWPEQGADPETWNDAHVPDALLDEDGVRWGLFVDDALTVAAIEFELRMHLRGDWHDVAGVSSGVTPPEFRRQGHVLQFATRYLHELRDLGVNLISGWEFNTGYWRRFGLALVGTTTQWRTSPRALLSAVDVQTGRYRRVGPDDWDTLDRIHREHVGRYALTVDRSETWWREYVLDSFDGRPHVAVWERDGEPRGYVVYKAVDGGDVLTVRDAGYVDLEAYRHLLRYLGLHDMRTDEVSVFGPESTEMYDVVRNPGRLDCQVVPGPSLRIVDVAETLGDLSYPEGVSGTVDLEVSDEVVDWNDGTFRLSISGGGADCEPADVDPDVSVDLPTLSQLVGGYRPVRALERNLELTVHDEAAAETLAAALPEQDVFSYDNF